MYTSLLISLLAAFVAMLGKQWLNRYLSNSGGSMIERCGDRQRKCDGLKKWSLHLFVESLPVMLQVSLLLLACGLCRRMWIINTPVASILIGFTSLGVIFYIAIVIAGVSSYACPLQTPASIFLRGSWKKVRSGIVPFIHSGRAHRMWKRKAQPGFVSLIDHSKQALSWTREMWNRGTQSLLRHQSLPMTMTTLSEYEEVQQSESWLKQKDLAIICRVNIDDALCVSWILRNVTDPEALDAALPPAGEVRWFDDGVNVNPPYDLIVSVFEGCFDSTRRLYPESRDRAYYAGRAILWIHTLAMCKSEDVSRKFPLPNIEYTTPVPDPDLEYLLRANRVGWPPGPRIGFLLRIDPGQTPPHLQWTSNLLLHYFCANLAQPYHKSILDWFSNGHRTKTTIPLNTTLNRILVWCTFFGTPIEEEALKVQDKSYDISHFCSSSCSLLFTSDRTEPILHQLSKVVLPAINGTPIQQQLVMAILYDLVRLETTPVHLTKITYEWCSVIYENRESVPNWEILLLLCLEIGFRHLDFQRQSIKATITHTEHHRGLVDVVFRIQESEVIADLLHAWTTESDSHAPAAELPGLCARHLVGLQNLVPLSPRLRRLVIRSVELTDYAVPEEVGVGRFIEFLNHLHATTKDIDDGSRWARLLVGIIQSSKEPQRLSDSYWELLTELAVVSQWLIIDPTNSLQTTTSLIEAEEWSKLECWMGIVWMLLPEEADPREGNLGDSMTLLFHQRPKAVQKLEQWIEQWGREHHNRVPRLFQQILQTSARSSQTGHIVSFLSHPSDVSCRVSWRFIRFRPVSSTTM